jgi:hypothetical protein
MHKMLQILSEFELMYDIFLLILCITGLFMHPFFYSALVRRTFYQCMFQKSSLYLKFFSFSFSMW